MITRLFILLLIALFTAPASAAQPLVFRDRIKSPREQELLDYLKLIKRYNPNKPFVVAPIDLNGDGVEEWIFRQDSSASCESDADCPYSIAGISEGEIVLLGEMRGGKIGVSDEKQYGVRNLLVYNEKNDDYAYQAYVWTPAEAAFRPQ